MTKKNTLALFILLIGISACSEKKTSSHHTPVYTKATLKKIDTHLYYNDSLAPLKGTPVIAPADGIITKINFNYGEKIEKGQEIIKIKSTQIYQDYSNAVTKYLTSKNTLTQSKVDQETNKLLYKNGLISKQEKNAQDTSYYNNIINMYQSQSALEKILKELKIKKELIENLSLKDASKMKSFFQKQFNILTVKSKQEGIALLPTEAAIQSSIGSTNPKGSGTSKLFIGSKVVNQQLLISVGDLNGFSSMLHINEIDINKIKKNDSVTVTSPSFPNIKMHGYIKSISSQANAGSGGAQSNFNVGVIVNKLPKEAKDKVRIGMTAKFDIHIPDKERLYIPISSVITKKNQQAVYINENGKITRKVIRLGKTTPTLVEVKSGLKAGDKVMTNPMNFKKQD